MISSDGTHADLILEVIRLRGYQSYLEIGCQADGTFARVDVRRKVGVDPVSGGTVRMTSNEFFASNREEMFDAIFIDGDHHHDQVLVDAYNALWRLNEGGTLLLHDCSPPDAAHESQSLCGTAWRAFATLRERRDINAVVADWDFGTGLVRFGVNPDPIKLPRPMDNLTWSDFEEHRHDWMKCSSAERVSEWLEQALQRRG